MIKILIVDDEPIIRLGLEKLIRQSPDGSRYQIRSAADGEEALYMIGLEQPDYLFTDIRMPKIDGLELCRRLAESGTEIQMVVVSGYGDFEYARQSMSYGVRDYVLKPVVKAQLFEVLAKLKASTALRERSDYLSVAKLDEWADRMDAAVWMLDREELKRIADGWRQEYDSHRLTRQQRTELLNQLLALMLKKLAARGFQPAGGSTLQEDSVDSAADLFQLFEARLTGLLEELKLRRKGKPRDPVEAAKAYIDSRLTEEVTLEEVADMLGLNPSYFSQLFKQTTGETFVHYRIRMRMEKAKLLLAMPHYRITDVSYEVGYADHPHFTKTFKKVTGLSPSEYRSSLGID
jgi:two-component system, response regulator YesN